MAKKKKIMRLGELLDFPLVQRLLKFNVTFHSEIVAEALGGTGPQKFFERGGVAVASIGHQAFVFAERELHDWVVLKKTNEYLTHRLIDFELMDDDGLVMRLKLYCWKAAAGNGMTPRLDIDLLFLNRSGLNVATGEQTNAIPVPLTHLMQRCKQGIYALLADAIPDDKVLMSRLRALSDCGWVQEGSSVKFVDGDVPDDACPICHEPLSAKSTIVTPCGHHFHDACWSKHVDHSVQRAEVQALPEPLRASPFQFGVDMRGQAIYITCPMCREGMRCIRTVAS